PPHHRQQLFFFRTGSDLHQFHGGEIAVHREAAVFIPDVGDPAGHSRGKVPTRGSENQHASAGHVLTAMVADTFDDGVGTAVAHTEPFGGAAAEVGFPAGGTIQADVADDDVLGGDEAAFARRRDDHPAAREPLADIIV